eukprot:1401085-Rhodomonas_salina.5
MREDGSVLAQHVLGLRSAWKKRVAFRGRGVRQELEPASIALRVGRVVRCAASDRAAVFALAARPEAAAHVGFERVDQAHGGSDQYTLPLFVDVDASEQLWVLHPAARACEPVGAHG